MLRPWVEHKDVRALQTLPAALQPLLLRRTKDSKRTNGQPIITAVAAYLLLGERLTPALGLAALGLFSGMALVARRPR